MICKMASVGLRHFAAVAFCFISIGTAVGQGTLADYQRAHDLQAKARPLVVDTPGQVTWIGNTEDFWYPKTVKGGTEFILVNADENRKASRSIMRSLLPPSPRRQDTPTQRSIFRLRLCKDDPRRVPLPVLHRKPRR